MASADQRWQSRALEAWSAGKPLPPRASDENVLEQCMSESARAVVGENEALRQRLREVSKDRDGLRSMTEDDRLHFRETYDRVAKALGDAANKPTPPAVATANATSEGRAGTERSVDAAPGGAKPAEAKAVAQREAKGARPPERKARAAPACTTPDSAACDPARATGPAAPR